MTLQYNLYVFVFALNTVLAGVLFLYTWKLKKAAGARYFAYAIFACVIWDFANIFELSSTILSTKILFKKISYIGALSVPTLWLFFAIAFSQKYKIKKIYILLWVIPLVVVIATWTNEFHNLIWTNIYLTNSPYGIVAIYKHGIIFNLSTAYSYSLILTGTIIFIKEALDFPKIYRSHTLILILVVCIPWCSDILYVTGLAPIKELNPETFTFTISAALVVFGYFRLKLLSIAPIAQEIISSNIHEGIIVTDVNNYLVEANRSALEIFNNELKTGEKTQQAFNKYFPDLLINRLGKKQEIFVSFKSKECWYEFNISLVKDFKGDPLGKIFIFRDITERKMTEKVLKESEKHLSELNEIKNKFFSILSHDLRSPFSGLMGFVEILKEDFDSLSNKEKENFIDEIDLTTKNIYGFLEDLLEWSRLNMGSFKTEIKVLNMYNEVEDVFHLLTYNARRKCINLVNELNQHDTAIGDSAMVKLLFRNLISNAIKFSHEGDTIRVYSRTNCSHIEICVTDTGMGIPAEALSKLFRLDEKHSTAGTAGEKGSGIGLVLCKEIIDRLNGKIKAESVQGEGSSFTFSLPIKQAFQ